MEDSTATEWDDMYFTEASPPWEVGHPQPAFVDLAAGNELDGRILDVGCGTGEHALHFARQGLPVTGIDLSERAIDLAQSKADADLDVRFHAGDVFEFFPETPYDIVIDSLLLHTFDSDTRTKYVAHLKRLVAPEGGVYILSFSDRADSDIGPATLSRHDFRELFADGWDVQTIDSVSIESHVESGLGAIPGHLVTVVPS